MIDVEMPKITIGETILFIILIIKIIAVMWIANDNLEKGYLISNLTANLTAMNKSLADYNKLRDFVYDYDEYSEICSGFQLKMKDSLAYQCTSLGFEFMDFYVSYPANDYLIICKKPNGEAHLLRFR